MAHARAVVLSLAAVFVASCGGRNAGDAVRPAAPTAREALGEDVACRAVGASAEPLIVDWKSNERTDLEVAMKEGVAVVAYDCKTLRLVKGCSVHGEYAFAGVSRRAGPRTRTIRTPPISASPPFASSSPRSSPIAHPPLRRAMLPKLPKRRSRILAPTGWPSHPGSAPPPKKQGTCAPQAMDPSAPRSATREAQRVATTSV